MSRFGIFKISGTPYDLDDLDLDEMGAIEDLAGGEKCPHCGRGGEAFGELNFGSSKTMRSISLTLIRRNDPEFTWEQAGKVKMIDFAPPDEEMPSLPPDRDDEASQSGSEQDGSGVPPSVVSITG